MNKVKLSLAGLDGNAFALLGAFQRAARNQGWPKVEIDKVLTEAKKGDYDHLLHVLMDNTTEEDE